MALGNVFMTDTDGNIGSQVVNNTDKICGLLFDVSGQENFWTQGAGARIADKWQNKIVELNSLQEAVEAGITPFTGETEAITVGVDPDQTTVTVSKDVLAGIPYYHIAQFFGMAGGSGRLFVMFADCSENWRALIDMQKACNGVINQFGVWTEQLLWSKMDAAATTYSVNIVGDLQSVAQEMANDYFAPASILLCANTSQVKTASGNVKTVAISEIADAVINARYVSVLLGQAIYSDDANKWQNVQEMQASLASTAPVGVVGLALGTLTQCNVGESLGWVEMFDLVNYVPAIEMGFGNSTIANGALTNSTKYSALTKYQLDDLDDKGYIFLRTYEGLEGHTYFTKDQTCSKGDFCTIARNRAINKSRRSIRAALLPYVNSPVKVDPSSGNLSAAQTTVFKNLITDVLAAMETAEEISAVGTVDVPATQNILATKRLKFSYSIIPLGCAEAIDVEEGLAIKQ